MVIVMDDSVRDKLVKIFGKQSYYKKVKCGKI